MRYLTKLGNVSRDPILENVPCALEDNVYSAVVGWSILSTSVRFSLSIVLGTSSVLGDLLPGSPIYDLKWGIGVSYIIVELPVSSFNSVKVCFLHVEALMFSAYS